MSLAVLAACGQRGGTASPESLESPRMAPSRVETFVSAGLLLVRGAVNLATGAAILEPTFPLDRGDLTPSDPSGTLELRLLDSNGGLLHSARFTPASTEIEAAAEGQSGGRGQGTFQLVVPNPGSSLHEIAIFRGAVKVASATASASPPTVTISPPEATDSEQLHISWDARDADGDSLTFILLYSPDEGVTWEAISMFLDDSSASVPRSVLRGSDEGMIQVLVSDGVNSTSATTEVFTVQNQPPLIVIQLPAEDQSYSEVQLVYLQATPYDPEAKSAEGVAITWSSDVDGIIATGDTVEVPASSLSRGTHVLTATAQDVDGAHASASVTISVS